MKKLNKFMSILMVILFGLMCMFYIYIEKDITNKIAIVVFIVFAIFMELYTNRTGNKKIDHIIRMIGNTFIVIIILFTIIYACICSGIVIYKNDIEQLKVMIGFLTIVIIPVALTPYILYKIEHSNSRKHRLLLKNKYYPENPNPFRDLPFNDDIALIYFVAREYNLLRSDTDYLGALILNWFNKGYINLVSTDDKKTVLVFKNKINEINGPELLIYNYLKEACIDGILEAKEFQKYCQQRNLEINNILFNNIIKPELSKLSLENKYVNTVENNFLFGLIHNKSYNATDLLNKKAQELAGLKLFLKDFTITDTLKPEKIKMYQEYLIYAQILGVATTSIQSFTDLLHESNTQKVLDFMQDIKHDKSSISNYFNSNFML